MELFNNVEVFQDNLLVKTIKESNLEPTKAQILLDKFSNFFEIAADWERKAKMLIVNDPSQKAEMKMAGEGRKFLKEKRVDVEKTRKALKESALREGQTIDAIAKILTNLIIPIEEDLKNKEKYIELLEAKRVAELEEKRKIELQPYLEFVPLMQNLGAISESDYEKILTGAKLQQAEKIELEKKLEAERIAKELEAENERQRIIQENIKLKAEREAAEAEKAKLEAELKAQKAKETAELTAKLEAESKAREFEKTASDNDKLQNLCNIFKSIEMPNVNSIEANNKIALIKKQIEIIINIINK